MPTVTKGRSKLQKEGGVTAISLENAEILIAEHGRPNLVKLWYDERAWCLVTVEWPDDYKHTFSGFSWGYAGEGPCGLAGFAEMIGLGHILNMRAISGFPQETEKLFRFTPRTFGGEPEWIC